MGATASGKSELALTLARHCGDVEIVSIDSMQVYRRMDIGTAKPSTHERCEVPHHLIDLVEPWESFSVARFQRAAAESIAAIEARGRRALLVGGTGLYVRAVVDGLAVPPEWPEVRAELDAEPDTAALHRRLRDLDPLGASRMEPGNRRRILRALEVTIGSGRPFSSFGCPDGLGAHPPTPFRLVGLWLPRHVLRRRIGERLAAQMERGFLDEVERLLADPRGLSRTAAQALGYRELLAHLRGEVPLEDALAQTFGRTTRFARRQWVWFRRDPRVTWLAAPSNPLAVLPALLRQWAS